MLHETMMQIARETALDTVEPVDGEMCFNLYQFLTQLGTRVFCKSEILQFNLDRDLCGICNYLWCCLCSETGDNPDGNRFRDMPIVD